MTHTSQMLIEVTTPDGSETYGQVQESLMNAVSSAYWECMYEKLRMRIVLFDGVKLDSEILHLSNLVDNTVPDMDDLDFARETLGAGATYDEVYGLAERRAIEAAEEGNR